MNKTRLILFFLLIALNAYSQKKEYSFQHITTIDGISNSYVIDIVQDKDGFMWFGTQDGLNRYDGSKVVLYRNDPNNPGSISHNLIRKLFIDRDGNLWIGTDGGGLSFFQKETDSFINYKYNPADENSISHNAVLAIEEDLKGNLWVGTFGGGLNYFDRKKNKFTHFKHNEQDKKSLNGDAVSEIILDRNNVLWVATRGAGLDRMTCNNSFVHYTYNQSDKNSISGNYLTDLYEDSDGNIWIGTDGAGLNKMIKGTNAFIRYQAQEDNPGGICHNNILAIEEDAKHNIWIGTENGGISILKNGQHTFTNLKADERNEYSINNNSIHSLFCDNKGNMWVGTYSGGVNYYNSEPEKFIHYKHSNYNDNSLNNNNVLSLYLVDKTNLLIGTDGGGLNILNLIDGNFKHYTYDKHKNSIASDYVLCAFEDRDKDIWLGSYKGGLNTFNVENSTFKSFKVDRTEKGASDNSVGHIIQDHKGYIWIANYGQGISRYDKKTKTFKHYYANSDISGSLSHGVVFTLYEDKKGNIWVGTEGGGLNLLDRENNSFSIFKHIVGNNKTISNNIVNAIFEDSRKNIWVGTYDGLNLFDPVTKSFKSFFEKDGLPNNVIQSIQEDNKGNLWLGTNRGISRLNPKNMKFKNYSISDGLQGNSYNKNAAFKDHNGAMYFGGLNGFNIFHPDSIKEDKTFFKTFITDFKLFNKSIAVGDKDSILKKSLNYTNTIVLDYKQSFFSFDFISLDYAHPENHQYAYKLDGFNDDWIYIGNNKSATYTNLSPGEYVFRVKSSNNEGDWGNNERSIKLIITPPFWETLWFKFAMIGAVVILLVIIFRARTRYIRNKNKWLLEEVKQATKAINNQKEEILIQKNHIEEKSHKLSLAYNDIQDSIQYAKTIQEGMLQNVTSAYKYLNDLFILLKPRDVVSGDFYWYSVKNDKIIIAAADCTGHGVPGALMSMVGNALLNQIVNIDGIIAPDKILMELNNGIRSSLKQDETGSRDGMDIALCVIDKANNTLEYSGAFSPLYLIQNETIQVIKGNNHSVGGGKKNNDICFTKHTVNISTPTVFYIFSDGYHDQVGGPEKIKFMKTAMRELLFKIHIEPMDKQKEILEDTIEKWRGDEDQRDDMLVIGVRI